ncbi:hypothetical protein LTR53_019030, partial [Teratosphaeriaceae sp. CCFEE 6253]
MAFEGSINPDLGGVGMIIAYLIQFSILLWGWMLASVNELGPAATAWFTKFIAWRRGRKTGRREVRPAAPTKRLQQCIPHLRHWHERQSAALNSTLVEFQKTQAFFVLAVVVGALLAVQRPAYLQVLSWRELLINLSYIYVVALSGCYPIVLNLLVLRKTKSIS